MPLSPAGIALHDLAGALHEVGARVAGDASVRVRDVREDSRRIRAGDLFAARRGERENGLRFAADAVRRGATAILAERDGSEKSPLGSAGVPVVEVSDVRRALGIAAEHLHGHPTRSLKVVGITGTNGKTTTAWLAGFALDGIGAKAARLGTLGYSLGTDHVETGLTTPGADELSRLAARARDGLATHFVMEVSSHALAQRRVDALGFAVAAFTNLTQDHLDFHGSMEAYGAHKARLFLDLQPGVSVINVDDPFGAQLAERCPGRVLRVGRSAAADVRPLAVEATAKGIRGRIAAPSGEVDLETTLVGTHNLENLLVVLGVVEALGLDVAGAAARLLGAPAVPGRLERCDDESDDVTVLVDYAHTPDALRRALVAVRALTAGRVTCVFGCGGDRDPDKRAPMGSVVGAAADRAIITNDNPRTEAPETIAAAVEAGLRPHGIPYEICLDRTRAIERAVMEAGPGDVVLIAGKGHETYQLLGTERRSFDDRVEARRALARRRERPAR